MTESAERRTSAAVDVVMPVHDGAETIGRAISSVIAQRFPRWHLVVVDDGSTDDTLGTVRSFSDDRIDIVESAPVGASAARNLGAAAGVAPHIAFLDADDEVRPDWLGSLLRHSDADLVRCSHEVVSGDSVATVRAEDSSMLAGCFVVRRRLFDDVGGYDERFAYSENTDLALRFRREAVRRRIDTVVLDASLVRIHRRSDVRARTYGHLTLARASELLLAEHAPVLSRYELASFSAVAGLNRLALGDRRTARDHLRRAVRHAPRRLRYRVRLAQTHVPFATAFGIRGRAR